VSAFAGHALLAYARVGLLQSSSARRAYAVADGRYLCDPCHQAELVALNAGLRMSWDVRGLSTLPATTVRCASCGAVL
jgi:hypothetical protein